MFARICALSLVAAVFPICVYSPGLVRLGAIEAGVEKLARVGETFTMTMERIE